jgi:hypothetical protein
MVAITDTIRRKNGRYDLSVCNVIRKCGQEFILTVGWFLGVLEAQSSRRYVDICRRLRRIWEASWMLRTMKIHHLLRSGLFLNCS